MVCVVNVLNTATQRPEPPSPAPVTPTTIGQQMTHRQLHAPVSTKTPCTRKPSPTGKVWDCLEKVKRRAHKHTQTAHNNHDTMCWTYLCLRNRIYFFFRHDQTSEWTQISLFSRPSICSSKRHLLSQWDLREFRVGPSSGYRGSQRLAVQRVVYEVLRRRRALWGLFILPWRHHWWREGRWRGKCWGRGRRDGGAFGHGCGSIRSSPDRAEGVLGDSAQPGGPHQLLLPHPGHECSVTPNQWANTLRRGQHHNEPGR